jgi:homoserine kinase
MAVPMNEVTTRVPATTANLGPGYDCLGVALQIYNSVTVARAESASVHSMAAAAADAFFARSGTAPFPFSWKIAGDVPQSRGLGSSVTVRLGLLHGLNALSGAPLDSEGLFEICVRLEGHPDNAAPAAFGGFTVARAGAETLRCEVAEELRFVLLIPDFEISTPAARAVLPATLERLGAVDSCGNACRITAAFFQRRYDLLRGIFADHLHQPFREPLIPFLGKVIAAGESAGALAGFLSGSGSTICCLALSDSEAVGKAMLSASGQSGARIVIASADNEGAQSAWRGSKDSGDQP